MQMTLDWEVLTMGKTFTQEHTALGIEFGSTRIKAVLIDEGQEVLAIGTHDWENRLEDGVWTYSETDIIEGLQGCYASLAADVHEKYGVELTTVGALGISGMMHGYIALDEEGKLLVPFRTWRNTMTSEACRELSPLFAFNIPQRWSIAHLYQAMLKEEAHVPQVAHFTTLAGFVHDKLTGERVLGIGEASGMFPIDSETKDYDAAMLSKFDQLAATKVSDWYDGKLRSILPRVLVAGEAAGALTEAGARLLDPTGKLQAGIPLCPPEGDAGTGMVATNAVAPRTGNVSAGTSIFAMVVLQKLLPTVHEELDMVTTPDGAPVAMVHCNNCTSDLNAWVKLFAEAAETLGAKVDRDALYSTLFKKSLEGAADCDGILNYSYYSGEPVVGMPAGKPLLFRSPDSTFSLANVMRSQLYGALAALAIGMDILRAEHVAIDSLTGHGGFFKTPGVGQRYLAAAMHAPVTVMDNAGEGGAWGMAILAAYLRDQSTIAAKEDLATYLSKHVFAGATGSTLAPEAEDVAGFERYLTAYREGLAAEKAVAH